MQDPRRAAPRFYVAGWRLDHPSAMRGDRLMRDGRRTPGLRRARAPAAAPVPPRLPAGRASSRTHRPLSARRAPALPAPAASRPRAPGPPRRSAWPAPVRHGRWRFPRRRAPAPDRPAAVRAARTRAPIHRAWWSWWSWWRRLWCASSESQVELTGPIPKISLIECECLKEFLHVRRLGRLARSLSAGGKGIPLMVSIAGPIAGPMAGRRPVRRPRVPRAAGDSRCARPPSPGRVTVPRPCRNPAPLSPRSGHGRTAATAPRPGAAGRTSSRLRRSAP